MGRILEKPKSRIKSKRGISEMEKDTSNIKILISHHKESKIIASEIMMPVQVGAKNSAVDLNIQRDDEGVNISEKNDRYCELTAQYWAWKNIDADYYGFMHYRRHFSFRDTVHSPDDDMTFFYPYIGQKYLEELGMKDEIIHRCVEGSDLILPIPVDTMTFGAVSNEVQYSCLEYQHASDFDLICKLVIKLYPEYADAVQKFRMGHYAYFLNMFIMKKEIFMDYSEWLFHILEEAEKQLDCTNYSSQERRVLAYMSERLLNIYIIKRLRDQPELKCKHLQTTFVRNTDLEAENSTEEFYQTPVEIEYFASSVEKAYRKLNELSLPYDMEELFLDKESSLNSYMQERKLMFYGGGVWCKRIFSYFDKLGIAYPLEIWDRDAQEGHTINGVPVVKPNFISCPHSRDILWIITIYNQSTSDKVKQLLTGCGVTEVIDNRTFVKWLCYQLWLRVKNEAFHEGTLLEMR